MGSASTFNLTFTGPSGSDNARLDDICITVEETSVSYSNYVTNCCAIAPATNLTVSGTTSNTATLTWTAPSPTTGITKLQVRNADNDAVVVDNIAVGTTTATITGLTECTKYNYYVASVGDCEVFSNTVTAQPFSNAKTVNYDYNGGSGSPASFTTSCENQVITLPTATRAGYDFNGWYTAATGGTKVGDAGGTYNPTTSPITLYAQWTKQIYIISFHANGGIGTMANQSADENDVVAQLNANQFTRDGYAFVGWNTKANGTGILYYNSQELMISKNITLYAQWNVAMENGHEFVDLGLSVKWATMNVGADSPADVGVHYAWGGVDPMVTWVDEEFQPYKDVYFGENDANPGCIGGNVEYDIATRSWGDGWRMPTEAEFEELINECEWSKYSLNGQDGLLVEGPNGNSIFLPAAGGRSGLSLYDAGQSGRYWSSTPYEYLSGNAYYLYFSGSYYGWDYGSRDDGRSVRPVSK